MAQTLLCSPPPLMHCIGFNSRSQMYMCNGITLTPPTVWHGLGWYSDHTDSQWTLHCHTTAICWHQLPLPEVQCLPGGPWQWPGHWVPVCHSLWCPLLGSFSPHHTCIFQSNQLHLCNKSAINLKNNYFLEKQPCTFHENYMINLYENEMWNIILQL